MKWRAKTRNQIILLSVIIQLVILAVVAVVWWIAQQPPSPYDTGILAAQAFFTLLITPIGWLVIFAISCFSTLMSVLATRSKLRQLGSPPARRRRIFTYLGLIGFFAIQVVVLLFWGAAAYFIFLMYVLAGLGIPAVWPSYFVCRRWENQHQKTLVSREGRLVAVTESNE